MKKCDCGHIESKHTSVGCRVWNCDCRRWRHAPGLDRVNVTFDQLQKAIDTVLTHESYQISTGNSPARQEELIEDILAKLRTPAVVGTAPMNGLGSLPGSKPNGRPCDGGFELLGPDQAAGAALPETVSETT